MSEPSFDPAVVALLEEIARDPRAQLLRMPKERLNRWTGQSVATITPFSSTFTKAERHLADAYREQAAAVLHGAAVARLASGPETNVFLESSVKPDMAALEERERKLRASHWRESSDAQPLVTVDLRSASASELAAASLRLISSDLVRIALASAHHVEGRSEVAIRALHAVLLSKPQSVLLAVAHDVLGGVHCSTRNFAVATENYGKSKGCWRALASRLAVELQMGRADGALRSDRELTDSGVSSEAVRELVDFMAQTRRSGVWAPTALAMEAIQAVGDRLSEHGRRVCSALLPIHA